MRKGASLTHRVRFFRFSPSLSSVKPVVATLAIPRVLLAAGLGLLLLLALASQGQFFGEDAVLMCVATQD